MALPGILVGINKAAVAAAKAGNHQEALKLYDELFARLTDQHLTHPDLYVAYSNRAASHLALQQPAEALKDAQQCVLLLREAAAHAGLLSCSRHPYWPKACQRLGAALLGLRQHQQAVSVFEAGLAAEPLNPNLKSGLQQAQQGLVTDVLRGKTLNHLALPAPPTPERITLAPHNSSRAVLRALDYGSPSSNPGAGRFEASNLGPGRKYAVGWQLPPESVVRAAEAGQLSVALHGDLDSFTNLRSNNGGGSAAWRLPSVLLTPEAAVADPGLKDVYEYLKTQCDIALPKRYLHRELPDSARLSAWCQATKAAVQEIVQSGGDCRVLLLGAKAGLLALATLRAGATRVICNETCPHLAAACQDLLLANGLNPATFHVTTAHPTSLRLGKDLPTPCNLLIADIIDDGVLSGGFITAVAHALDELLVKDNPLVVPAGVTVMAQAVSVRPSGCWTSNGDNSGAGCNGRWLDLSALDEYRWTPSQSLPTPLDPTTFKPMSQPFTVWHMPAAAVTADVSGVSVIDVELLRDGPWCGMLFWAELQLFGDVTYSTAGPWKATQAAVKGVTNDPSSTSSVFCVPSQQPGICWFDGEVPVKSGDVYPLVATHNTVRLSFTLQAADYSRLFIKDPSFPHRQFAMATDQKRIAAYYQALKAAMRRSAVAKQQQQQSAAAAVELQGGEVPEDVQITVLNVGCGSGVLSLLAAAAANDLSAAAAAAAAAEATAAVREHDSGSADEACDNDLAMAAAAIAGGGGGDRVTASVIAAEFVAPVAAAALRNVAANGYSGSISVVHSDAAMLQRSVHVPLDGVDVVVLDVFDAGLIGHQVLPLLETVKAKFLTEGGQVLPACATLYMMGVEISTSAHVISTGKYGLENEGAGTHSMAGGIDLSALERFRWSGEPETVLLSHLPHNQLTRPVKLFDFDFCQPLGTPYPSDTAVEVDVVAAGKLNAVVVWFDLHLAEGVSLTSAPEGFTTGGRRSANSSHSSSSSGSGGSSSSSSSSSSSMACKEKTCSTNPAATPAAETSADCTAIILHPDSAKILSQQQQEPTATSTDQHDNEQQQLWEPKDQAAYTCHHWGQSLHYLGQTAQVCQGDQLQFCIKRDGPKILVDFVGGLRQQTCDAVDAITAERPGGALAAAHEAVVSHRTAADSFSAPGLDEDPSKSSSDSSAARTHVPVTLSAAPRPPWLKPGAGIEDPNVWAVKKCQQLLGQMLQRAPGGKFPPIYKDLEIMQVHAGSLGLDAAVVGAVTQELCMQEAFAVAAQRQLAVSLVSSADAAGLKPPVVWK